MYRVRAIKEQLLELRRRGVFAWSEAALRSAVVIGVALAILACSTALNDLFDLFATNAWLVSQRPLLEVLPQALRIVGKIVLISGALVLLFGLGGCLVQTQGVAGVKVLRRSGQAQRKGSPLRLLLGFVLITAVGAGAAWEFAGDFLGGVRLVGRGELGEYYGHIILRLCKLVVVAASVLAILFVFVSKLLFRIAMRTSRRA